MWNLANYFRNSTSPDTSTESSKADLKVIGAGLARTGTMSLKKALEILYNQPCYHISEIELLHKDHIPVWQEIFQQIDQCTDGKLNPELVHQVLQGYGAVTSHTLGGLFQPLMDIYPNAKIILTVRDSNEWLQSVRDTVRPRNRIFKDNWIDNLIEKQTGGSCFTRISESSEYHPMGKTVNLADDQAMLQAFDEWNLKVQHTVPSDRLLVFDIKHGWKPLCEFLNLPLPAKEFPHANERNETKRRFNRIRYTKWFVKYILPATAIIAIAGIFKVLI